MSLSHQELIEIQRKGALVAIPECKLFGGKVINITSTGKELGLIAHIRWRGRTAASRHWAVDLVRNPAVAPALGRGKRRMKI
jgi:hypothetical protein